MKFINIRELSTGTSLFYSKRAQQSRWLLQGAPQTRSSVTALGKRDSYSLCAVPCLGAFGEL
ncbi:MAG: hypothetical protein [Olavius algarvensis Gamma 1 endosymbiont]|nr:MAG: hypothetical protein [Olavius algarvensis Gamma 1 endosymbiont]